MALLDKLKRDLEKDMQENEHDETTAQKDYERFMSDTVAARTADSTSVRGEDDRGGEQTLCDYSGLGATPENVRETA